MWAAIVSIIVGVWIMVAPGFFGFSKPAADLHYIVGPIVITIAIVAAWEFNRAARYLNLMAGMALAVTPFILGFDDRVERWNSIGCGVALIALSLMKGKVNGQYGGGWKVLFEKNFKFFQGQVVVITGASGGVGRVTAWEFAKQHATVVLIARDMEQLAATAKEVEVYGGKPIIIQCDVADHAKLSVELERVEREIGPIEVLINNAMNSVFAPFKDVTNEEFKRVTDVTYLGTIYCTNIVLKRMLLRNRGSIVFVGSALAYRGIPLQSAYCGAKHAIQGFYDSLRTELMHDKSRIKTCMVQLPAMDTTQFTWVLNKLPNTTQPMGKVYDPEVAAKAILFAARHNRREILVGFSSYMAIVGNKIAPWYADWVLARTAYQGQQTKKPVSPDQKDNLWKPVGEDRGAYGGFKNVSKSYSVMLWISMNRTMVRMVVLMVISFLAAILIL